jgi:acyl-CoA dehydrogenase
MNFSFSPKVDTLRSRLTSIMEEHVYPNESAFHHEIATGDRWQPTAVVEQLKERRAAGLWNVPARKRIRRGTHEHRIRAICEIMGRASGFAPGVQLLARHRQHGSAGPLRHAEQKKQWLDPLLASDIRSCFAMTERMSPRPTRRHQSSIVRDGSECDQRAQVVDF